ncbi:MAG TPA: hypothetical protein VKB69_03295 [Micromonosporaceae bacterium]|nr:hypothetical protein [Micromonosporaceae bacterium]
MRDAHKQNIALLNALRETQAEHGEILAEHMRRFDGVDRMLGVLMIGVHDIQLSIDELIRRTPPDDGGRSGQGAAG